MNNIGRRKFVSKLSVSAMVFSAFPMLRLYSGCTRRDSFVDVEITHGRIRGIRSEGVNIFLGIPYAGKVSGERRFQRPAPLESWSGVRDTLRLGCPSIQVPHQTYGIDEPKPAEDCLFLNIWTPANDNGKRPVMFYNHGGGFSTGSGGSVAQDGANLARNFNVVVVQTNHRLGLLGFLYLDELAGSTFAGSANMGMLDIVSALEWVSMNIQVFGGDPNNVMIFGESGGGAKTSCLYAMPAAAPYFNKASIESGPGVRMTSREVAAETTALLLKELNIAPKDWRKLLAVPAGNLLDVQVRLSLLALQTASGKTRGIGGTRPGGFGPVVDGLALPIHPFDPSAPEISRNKPLMVGWNEDEYTFFAMYNGDTSAFKLDFSGLQDKLKPQYGNETDRIIETYRKSRPGASATDIYIAIASVTMMGLGSVEIAEKKSLQHAAPVFLYNFGYKSEVTVPGTDYALGTPHAMDITFKFNNEVPPKDTSRPSKGLGGNRPERFTASQNMAEFWTTFAGTGKPAAKGQPEWPAYNLADRPTMRIDTVCEVIHDRYREELQLWRSLGML
jgi:para-nitrobenzyl esterase